MTASLNRICIYGAGAIGGWLGLRLAQAGCDVSVVARGATLEAVKSAGLSLTQAASGKTENVRVRARNDPHELGIQDVVIVAVKAPAMSDVAKSIGPLIGPDTIVLTAMNGVPWWFFESFGGKLEGTALKAVDPDGSIARLVPGKQIIGCVVHASSSLDGPGHVRQHFGNKLIIGEPSGEKTDRVRALQALLERAGLEVVLSDQIQRDAWFKLWGNMTMNPISAITGATTDRVLDDDLVRTFIGKVMLEAKEIGARIGIPIDQQPEDRHQMTRKLGAFKTSMLQDVEAGKGVELDALVTVVKEMGALTNVDTPYTDALLGLARLHARVRGLY